MDFIFKDMCIFSDCPDTPAHIITLISMKEGFTDCRLNDDLQDFKPPKLCCFDLYSAAIYIYSLSFFTTYTYCWPASFVINPTYTCSLIIYIQSHASTHMSKHSATCMHDYEAQMMGNEKDESWYSG